MTNQNNSKKQDSITEVSSPLILTRHSESIESAIQKVVDESYFSLYPMLHYHLGLVDTKGNIEKTSRGKSLRSSLCLFTAEAVGGKWQNALPAATALELIHNFSLIHDDIQDEDIERRHRPTVWSIWGKPAGIIAGNTMRILADKALISMAQHNLPDALVLQMSLIFNQRYQEMMMGQVQDLFFEQQLEVSTSEYLQMIGGKTGALIDASMELGALSGGVDKVIAEKLGRCGRLLGLAFQLRDDLLGVWGDDSQTGKAVGADIRKRKKAFPAAYTIQKATKTEGEMIREIYQSKQQMNEFQIAAILEIMDNVNAQEATQNLAKQKCEQALQLINELELETWSKKEFTDLGKFLIHRNA